MDRVNVSRQAKPEDWASAIQSLLAERAEAATVCPSDVARAFGGAGWRASMDDIRAAARTLARAGLVRVTQRGRPLDPAAIWRGPIRIGRP